MQGKVAFVTGSAGGIGLGIARAFANAGMRVVLTDIDEVMLEESATALRNTGADVMAVALDVTDRDGWARAVDRVSTTMGPVQLLVNNAGVSTAGMRFDEIGPELWDRVIDINLTSVYNGVHFFLDGMRAAGGGHIVNTSSAAGLLAPAELAPYVATKAAIIGLSESLRLEVAESGIGVSVLCPGGVRSRLWRTSRAVRGLPDSDTPPQGRSGQTARAAMGADEVGQRVLDAVLHDELYIMTHPELRGPFTERNERLLRAFDQAEQFAPQT